MVMMFMSYCTTYAQMKLSPSAKVVEQQWLKPSSTEMIWYIMRDTITTEIGKVVSDIKLHDQYLMIVTQVRMKGMNSVWIDSSIALSSTLQPVYHASYNMQRDMVLRFGEIIQGYYTDKVKKTTTIIADTVAQGYFDSNLYPFLVRWLPLQDGYTAGMGIYDYNPATKGIVGATITNVTSGVYQSAKSGKHAVWLVSVNDGLDKQGNSSSTYFIDKETRQLWKQEIVAGGRKMLMVCNEK